jgi:hypothetical protein
MKSFVISLAAVVLLCGCASSPYGPDGTNQAPPAQGANDGQIDPTYPGTGVHIGIGVGSWGRHSGGGVGIGLGW